MGKGYIEHRSIIESSSEWNSADTLSIESCHAKCPQHKCGFKQFLKLKSKGFKKTLVESCQDPIV